MEKGIKKNSGNVDSLSIIGGSLMLIGLFLFIDSQLSFNVMLYLLLLILGTVGIFIAKHKKSSLLLLGSCILFCGGFAFFFAFSQILSINPEGRLGFAFLFFGLSWLLTFLLNVAIFHKVNLWMLLPGLTILFMGFAFAIGRTTFLDILFSVCSGLSISMLIWGYVNQWLGLIIPACLIGSTGLGVFLAWRPMVEEVSSLARVGIMLVVFAMGWVLITVLSRRVVNSFLWWPLIPAAVIGVTGWGLYIGGNPSGAGRFIGNTGSITLMIFGLYVLLLRRGFQKQ